jgi:hypothetical protein
LVPAWSSSPAACSCGGLAGELDGAEGVTMGKRKEDNPANPIKWAEAQRRALSAAMKAHLAKRFASASGEQVILVRCFIVAAIDALLWWMNHTPTGDLPGENAAKKDQDVIEIVLAELQDRVWSYGTGRITIQRFEKAVTFTLEAIERPASSESQEKKRAELAAFYDPAKWG